jgi:hypothetical protein
VFERYHDPAGALALDDRWFPVVIGTWWGEIGPGMMDAYFGWYDRQLARAREEQTKIALVIDALEIVRLSGEMRRRFIAESDLREGPNREHVASMCVVLRGALLRGILASVATLVRGALRVSSAGDVLTALERSLARLDHAGVARPAELDPRSYAAPPRHDES